MSTGEDAPRIAVVDYGMGNRRSVEKAVELVGGRPEITRDHAAIRTADGVIVPGVGAFRAAMDAVRGFGLDDVIRERAGTGVPLLGICLGMQILFDSSPEFGETEGLGLLPGTVAPLAADGLRLPHIGWSTVTWRRSSPLTERLPAAGAFYHVHSFAVRPDDEADVLGTAEYGETFVTAVARDNVYGVQFHAEKSSTLGLALLEGFVRESRRVSAPVA
jgi:imidazole glycerol-phosphate synthase subunit HisH